MPVTWIDTRQEIDEIVRFKVARTHSVLDIGAGIRPQSFFKPAVHICVDAYLPYLEQLQQRKRQHLILLNSTWQPALAHFLPQSMDSVFALDFIEHLPKKDGETLLKEVRRVARRQAVIFTPLGFYPQSYDDPEEKDRWGMGGGHWQTHRSGWTPEDFDDDWDLFCCRDYHFIDQDRNPLEQPFGAIWAFLNIDPALRQNPPYFQQRVRFNIAARDTARSLIRRVPKSVRTALRSRLR